MKSVVIAMWDWLVQAVESLLFSPSTGRLGLRAQPIPTSYPTPPTKKDRFSKIY